jgi:general secretion pathway protein M
MLIPKGMLVNNEIKYSRWLALGLLLFMFMLIIFVAIVPLVSTGLDYYHQKKGLTLRLQRSKQIVARKDTVLEDIENIKLQYQRQNYFSTRDTVALASADLQKFIKSTITSAGGQLTSTQVLPSTNVKGLKRISVKVRMSGDVEALRSVLYEIESAVPVMIVDQIDIRPVRGKRNRRTRKIEPSSKLNINFQATGFMRAEAS